jgi:hypothetical protein
MEIAFACSTYCEEHESQTKNQFRRVRYGFGSLFGGILHVKHITRSFDALLPSLNSYLALFMGLGNGKWNSIGFKNVAQQGRTFERKSVVLVEWRQIRNQTRFIVGEAFFGGEDSIFD